MESEGLTEFLKIVGDSVYSVNTICVGLSQVASGMQKPADLTIGWSSANPSNAAHKARLFALRASLVFVEEALLKYFEYLELCVTEDPELRQALKVEGAAEKVAEVSRHIHTAKPYWSPMVVLLVRWRNRVVHHSKSGISSHQKSVLRKSAEDLRANHAGIEIESTLSNFESNQITLKDFTTLIAITIRHVRAIDEQLQPVVSSVDGFVGRVRQRNLTSIFNAVMRANGEETRRRKLMTFLRSEFPSIRGDLVEEIYKNGQISSPSA